MTEKDDGGLSHAKDCVGKYCGICDCGATGRQAMDAHRRLEARWPRPATNVVSLADAMLKARKGE